VVSVSYGGELVLSLFDGHQLANQSSHYVHKKGINCVAFSPRGTHIATGASDATALLCDYMGNRQSILSHSNDVECVAFSEDGALLATGGTDGNLKLWNLDGGLTALVSHGGTVGAVVAGAGGFYTGCNDRKVRQVDATGQVVKEMVVAGGPIKGLALTVGGLFVASHDCTIRFLDLEMMVNRVVARFSTTPKSITASPDGKLLFVACYDCVVRSFAIQVDGNLKELASRRLPRVWGHAISAGDGFVVCGSFDGAPVLLDWDLQTMGDSPSRLISCISSMLRDDAGRLLAGGDSGILRCMDPNQPQVEQTLTRLTGAIISLCLCPLGVVLGSWAGELALFSAERGLTLIDWPDSKQAPCPILRVAANARTLLVGLYTGGARAFDTHDGRLLWSMEESTGASKCVDISDRYAVVTGRYDSLRLLDSNTGCVLARLDLATPVSDVVAFRPAALGSEPFLAVSAGDGEIWMVSASQEADVVQLLVLHKGTGHDLPTKAIAWIAPDAVVAGDYGGIVRLHQIGKPSCELARLPCRLGISSLVLHSGKLWAATFDGTVSSIDLSVAFNRLGALPLA